MQRAGQPPRAPNPLWLLGMYSLRTEGRKRCTPKKAVISCEPPLNSVQTACHDRMPWSWL